MRCCASPTTCNVDSIDAQHVRTTFEALMLSEILQPVMHDAGALGGYGVSYFAQLLAERMEQP
jgi:hypothetical protein